MLPPDDQSTPATLEYESKLRRNPLEKPGFRILMAFLLWLGAAIIGGLIGALF